MRFRELVVAAAVATAAVLEAAEARPSWRQMARPWVMRGMVAVVAVTVVT